MTFVSSQDFNHTHAVEFLSQIAILRVFRTFATCLMNVHSSPTFSGETDSNVAAWVGG